MTAIIGKGISGSGQRWSRRFVASMAGALIFVLLIAASLLVIATGPRAEPVAQSEREWPVSYHVAVPAPMSPSLKVFGRLESEQQAALRSAVTATVADVRVQEGEWVNRGDTLIVLDESELALVRRSAEALVRHAEAALQSVINEHQLSLGLAIHHEAQSALAANKLARFEALHEQRMIADAQLDEVRHEANERAMVQARHQASLANHPQDLAQAESALNEAQARLAQTELDLNHTRIKAPFNGRVLRIQAATGDRITAGTWLADVADYDRLRVRAPLPLAIAEQLRLALQQCETVIARSVVAGHIVDFPLHGVAGAMRDGQSGIDAFFQVSAETPLMLGGVVDLNVILPHEHDAVALPIHAVYDNNRIYRIQDNRLEALPVERVGDYVEGSEFRVLVRSTALKEGDHIMISQLPAAMTGLKVLPQISLAGQ